MRCRLSTGSGTLLQNAYLGSNINEAFVPNKKTNTAFIITYLTITANYKTIGTVLGLSRSEAETAAGYLSRDYIDYVSKINYG